MVILFGFEEKFHFSLIRALDGNFDFIRKVHIKEMMYFEVVRNFQY